MVGWRVAFGVVVSHVEAAWRPEYPELPLCFSAAQPVKLHVHGLGFARDYGFIGDPNGGGVVALDWAARLRPAHFDEGVAQGDHFLGGEEEGFKFGFCCGAHDVLHYLCVSENNAI